MEALERGLEVSEERGERPCGGYGAGDDDVIGRTCRVTRNNLLGGGLQPAPRAVAHDCAADLAAGSEPDPDSVLVRLAPACLEHEARCGPFPPAAGNAEKLRPPLEARQPRLHRLGRKALAPLGAARGDDLATAHGGHAGAEAVPAL